MGILKWLLYAAIIVLIAIIILPIPILYTIKAAISDTLSAIFNAIASKLGAVANYKSTNSINKSNSIPATPTPPNLTIIPNKSAAQHKPNNIIINV